MHVNSFLKRHLSSLLMAGLIFFATAFLFMKNDRELDPNYQKNWWTLAFSRLPASSDLSFIITNHTKTDRFTYTLKNNTVTLETKEISIPQGTSRIIQPAFVPSGANETESHVPQEISAWPTNSPQDTYSIYQK